MRKISLLALTAIALLLLFVPLGTANSVQVGASVIVICPYSVLLQIPQVYPLLPGSVTANYTVSTAGGCGLTASSGTLTVINVGDSEVVYTANVAFPSTTNPSYTANLVIPTTGLSNTLYSAGLIFPSGGVSSSNTFLLVDGANVSITSFTAPQTASEGSPIQFGLGLQNSGGLSSGPISLLLSITGPAGYSSNAVLSSLSPMQTSNTFLILYNVTGVPGTYDARAAITYNSYGDIVASSNSLLTYMVTAPTPPSPPPSPGGGGGSGGSGGVAPFAPSLPQINFTYIPILNTGLISQVTQTQLCLKNTGTTNVSLRLSVDPSYTKLLSLSTYSLEIKPAQNLCVQTYLRAGSNVSTGVYTIPVYVSAQYQNGAVTNTTAYITYSIYSLGAGQPLVASQVTLANNGTIASGVVSITAPQNSTFRNATLVQWLPLSVARNASDITIYGLASNITEENSSYKISSRIGSLSGGQTVYEYYSIEGPTDPQLLLKSQYELYTLSAPAAQSVIRLAGISAPAITGANGLVTVSVLYTGTSPSNVTMFMVAPPGIALLNDSQSVRALPNQLVTREFKIIAHPSNGTYLMQLEIRAQGANLTYGVPVVISSGATGKHAAVSIVPFYARIGIFLALVIVVLLLLRGRLGRQRYSRERVGHLIRIREQIKRESESE